MTSRRTPHRALAITTVAALAAGTALLGLSPAGQAVAAPLDPVTITPNPATAGAEFQGWGNSLVWFANATGEYPDELRDELYETVFGAEGLNMNMARYNFGGGRASDVGDHFRPGGAVPGYWAEDTSTDPDSLYGEATTNYEDRLRIAELWDPENPDHYDWSKDAAQRWWLERLAADRDDLVLEGFVNSPPYFLTNSGYTTGNTPAIAEQMLTDHDAPEKFISYVVRVTEHLEDSYGVDFHTLTPFNEPCNGYWGTPEEREADGITPAGPTEWPNLMQEGAQICPGPGVGQQQNLISLLAAELARETTTTGAAISANDETNPEQFNTAWKAYDAETRDHVDQINVHTYWDGGAREARDYARAYEKPLWMSETGGDFVGSGFDPLSMDGGLGLALKITSDLRMLQPEAYILWQEVEDYYNMEQEAPRGQSLNWGSVFIDFDCRYVDADGNELYSEDGAIGFKSLRRVADAQADGIPVSEVADCGIVRNQKFNTMRNFMHFITPGDRLIQTDNPDATAAVRGDGTDLSVVFTNVHDVEQQITLDLSGFAQVDGAMVRPYVTTQAPAVNDLSTALVEGEPVAVDAASRTATLTVPARSVTTFEVSGVSGVAESAPTFTDGSTYQLVGLQSSKALADGGEDGLVLRTPAETSGEVASQTWTVHEVPQTGRVVGRTAFVLESGDGNFAVFDAQGSAVIAYDSIEDAMADPGARWYPTTEDGTTWVLANGFNGNVMDVGGQATDDGAPVGWWVNSYGTNQRWTARDVSSYPVAQAVTARTQLGTAPELPETVLPVYAWGTGTPGAVSWDLPQDSAWANTGTVEVRGTATDIFGNPISSVVATVEVGPLTSVDPTSVKLVIGSTVAELAEAAPSVVLAQAGIGTSRFEVPVVWDFSTVTDADLAVEGVLSVQGAVAAADTGGAEVPATLYVILAEPTGSARLDVGCDVTATFTEPGYSPEATCDGDRTDKGWSNWTDDAREGDTLTYQLAGDPVVRSATIFFYKDGWHQSFPETFRAQYQTPGADEWVDVGEPISVPDSGTSPIVEVPLEDVQAGTVRFVMTSRPGVHLIVSEVEFYGPAAGPVSVADLARLTVNGVDVEGFDPETTEYTVPVVGSRADVVAVPVDQDADVDIERDGDAFTITVTATDGTEKVYELTLDKSVDLRSVGITGHSAAGSLLTANATHDPAEAELSHQWLRNGLPVTGATASTYIPVVGDVGSEISVTVTAEAAGYQAAELTSEPVTVSAADGEDPDDDQDSGDGGDRDDDSDDGKGSRPDKPRPGLPKTGVS